MGMFINNCFVAHSLRSRHLGGKSRTGLPDMHFRMILDLSVLGLCFFPTSDKMKQYYFLSWLLMRMFNWFNTSSLILNVTFLKSGDSKPYHTPTYWWWRQHTQAMQLCSYQSNRAWSQCPWGVKYHRRAVGNMLKAHRVAAMLTVNITGEEWAHIDTPTASFSEPKWE